MDTLTSALKVFVVVAGLALIAGATLLATLLWQRSQPEPAPGAAGAAPGRLVLPAGARIAQIVPAGPRTLLLAVTPEGEQYLATVDPVTGERLGLLRIVPE